MKRKVIFLIPILLFLPLTAFGKDKISVAVAENFISAFNEIAADFEEKTGVIVEATFDATGALYTQIKKGAVYDVFLSEDERLPDLLQQEGWAEGTFVYARGRTVLWSADKDFCKAATWQEALKNGAVRKIAISDSLDESYGASAKAALQKAGLWEAFRGKIVNGPNVVRASANESIPAVDAGFCDRSAALSPQGKTGCYYEIPEAPSVLHAGCILKNASNKVCAELFMVFMLSDQPASVKKKYGYR